MNKTKPESGRLQLTFVALVFLGPLILAAWMYMTGQLAPSGSSNKGALLEPVINVQDTLPKSPVITLADGVWLMLYENSAECDEFCKQQLHRLRHTRLMLGSEMSRIISVFLYGKSAFDRGFLDKEHPGLTIINDEALTDLLQEKRPKQLMPGGIYLIDPLSNLVMYFPPNLDSREMLDDLKHLLRLSRIG